MNPGITIAKVLAGSWRETPQILNPSIDPSQAVSQILLKTGAASLAWRVLSKTEFKNNPNLACLRQANRMSLLDAAVHERETTRAFDYLRSVKVEPILCKGWSVARNYPERGLRPYGDIDLLIRPEEYSRAREALFDPSAPGLPIDLHDGAEDLMVDRTMDQLCERSRLVPLLSTEIRILGPEDHLRLLCIHMLKHGAFRPLWLCDIALEMESLPQEFDWDYFLSGSRKSTDWAICALGLAHEVLGASLGNWPVGERARSLPRWLAPALLKQWSAGEFYIIDTSPLRAHLFKPAELLRAIRLRWPNPIHATVELGAPFNELPRLPLQILDTVRRTVLFALRLARTKDIGE